MKKLVIVGAGIAGLTCGIYACLNGFETEIYEMHTVPGGECTGWDRKGYHFDGCIHWLTGSKPGRNLYKIWRDTGALDDSVRVINHDIFVRYEETGKAVNFYTDANQLESHLIEAAPEDKREIKKFCAAIRALGTLDMPVERPMDMMRMSDGLKFAAENFSKFPKISRYGKMTGGEFAALFKNPILRRAMEAAIPDGASCASLLFTLAGMNAGDGGYPKDGSRAMAARMEKRFLDLGGRIFYGAKVKKISVEEGRAQGVVLEDGKEIPADHVISCADGYYTLHVLLQDRYTPEVYKKLFSDPKKYPTITSAMVFMGVDADIKNDFRALQIRRETPVMISGVEEKQAQIVSYAFDEKMAPEKKSVFSCFYRADYEYWKSLYDDREKYAAAKAKLAEDACAVLTQRFSEADGKIEVTDVVTPMTYERYCNAWHGSWMSWTRGGRDVPQYHSGVFPGLDHFIMAGMWTLPPGGLPGAATAGKFAAQRLCLKNGMDFKTE